MMRKAILFIYLLIPLTASAQSERKYIREGYKDYSKEAYSNAEVAFRKAEEENKESFAAKYNTTTAMYAQDNLEESLERMTGLLAETTDKAESAKLYHNIGNTLLKLKKYSESAESYKKSLRINPGDEDTRYNLTYALEKLREQEQQQQQQNQNQDQKNDDQQQNQQDQQDQQKGEDQQQEDQKEQQQNNKEQQNQDEQQAQQAQTKPGEMSQDEAERLLNAILEKEKDVKEEVDKKRAQQAKIKTDKDW